MIAGRSTRMEILELLRRRGRCSAETIANDLGVTANAIRQHLTNLERDGLVVSQPERSGRGRPALLFALTERADAVFPKRYGQLATMVLQEVQDMGGPEALDEVFARVAARRAPGANDQRDRQQPSGSSVLVSISRHGPGLLAPWCSPRIRRGRANWVG